MQVEVKGAKVFIKHGTQEFSNGILGNVKLLMHKHTGKQQIHAYLYLLSLSYNFLRLSPAIVFHCEPIWKVSMSIWLSPLIHCMFDAE